MEVANSPIDHSQSIYAGDRVFTIGTTTTNGTNKLLYVSGYEQGSSNNWERTFSGSLGQSIGSGICVSQTGFLYCAGSVLSPQQLNFFIAKLAPNGDTLWTKNIDGSAHLNDIPSAIFFDSAQHFIFLVGVTNWDLTNQNSTGDFWVSKLDTLGNEIFTNTYDNGFRDAALSGLIDGDNLVVLGMSGSSADSTQPFFMFYDIETGDSLDSYREMEFDLDMQLIHDIKRYPADGSYVFTGQTMGSSNLDVVIGRFANFSTIDTPHNWYTTINGEDDMDDEGNSISFDDQGRIFVAANLGKLGNKNKAVILTYLPTSDTTANLSSILPIENPDVSRNTELHRLTWKDQKLYAAGIQENASGQNDLLMVRQNNALGLDYTKISPNQNLKKVTSLKATNNGILFATGIAQSDSGDKYRSIKLEQIDYNFPPKLDSTEAESMFAFYQNRGQLVYADTISTDSVVKEVKYYTHNNGLPAYIRSKGWSIVVSAFDTSAATTDTVQRIDFDFVTPKSGSGKVYALDSTDFYLNYYLWHCPQGVTGVHANTGLLDKKVYNNMDVYYTGNNRGMRMQAAFGAGVTPSFDLEVNGADTVIVLDSNWVEVHTFRGIQYYRALAYQTDGSQLDSLDIIWDDGRLKFDVDGSYNNALGVVWQWDGGTEIQASNPNHFNLGWCSYFGNDDKDELTDVIVDNLENSYYCGSSSFSYFPLLEGVSVNDTIVNFTDKCILNIKIDKSIIPQWYTLIGVSENTNFFALNSIQKDNLGNIYSGGETNAPDLPLFTPPSAYRDSLPEFFPPSKMGLLVKMDSTGYVVWTTAFKDYGISDIVLDDHDNLFVTSGGFEPLHRFSTFGEYIAPLDVPEIGSETGGHTPLLNALAFKDSVLYGVGYVIMGHVRDTAPPDTIQPNPELERQFYHIFHKLDDGASVFADYNYFGSSSKDDYFSDVAVDGEHHVYMVGNTRRGQIPLKKLNPDNPDEYIDSLVNEGVIFRLPQYLDSLQYATYWGKGEGNNLPTKIAIDNDDNVYICGYTTSDSLPMPNGGNPEGYFSEPNSDETYGGDVDGYFLKLSPNCELLWSTYFYTKNSIADDRIYSIASDGGNRLYFTGTVNPKSDEGASHHIPYQDYNSSTMDYYQNAIVNPQFNEGFMGCFDSLKTENTAGIRLINSVGKDNILIYPNPGNSIVNILLPSICAHGEMEVLNIFGQPMISRKIENIKAVSVEISSYSPGSYILRVQDGGAMWVSKFVKQ